MSVEVDFRVLELLCGRLCHELISPVGAINNGVELLDEEDPEFVKEAMTLIGQSARKAGQRLQFYRFAYGTAGAASGGSSADGRDLSLGLLEGGKVRCEWSQEARGLALPWQRLGCNMLVLALEALPRGGDDFGPAAGARRRGGGRGRHHQCERRAHIRARRRGRNRCAHRAHRSCFLYHAAGAADGRAAHARDRPEPCGSHRVGRRLKVPG